jgi:hypothetical protein
MEEWTKKNGLLPRLRRGDKPFFFKKLLSLYLIPGGDSSHFNYYSEQYLISLDATTAVLPNDPNH